MKKITLSIPEKKEQQFIELYNSFMNMCRSSKEKYSLNEIKEKLGGKHPYDATYLEISNLCKELCYARISKGSISGRLSYKICDIQRTLHNYNHEYGSGKGAQWTAVNYIAYKMAIGEFNTAKFSSETELYYSAREAVELKKDKKLPQIKN